MTQKQTDKFLKYLKHKKKLSRSQICKHLCIMDEPNKEINHMLYAKYLKLVSEPIFVAGEFIENDDDQFSITVTANDRLDELKELFFLKRLPIIISILALLKSYGLGADDIILWCMKQLGL